MFLNNIILLCFFIVIIISDSSYLVFGYSISFRDSLENNVNGLENQLRIVIHPDLSVGPKVENYDDRSSLENPEELGNYFEGDIILQQNGKNGLVKDVYRWYNGVIPFEIKGTFG